MSRTALFASRWGFATFSCLTTVLVAGAAIGQERHDNELLDQVQRIEKVKAQKIEGDLRQTLQDVQHLPAASSAKAVERLKKALAQIEEDTVLPEARRKALTRMIKDRIRVTEADAANPAEKDKKPTPAKKRLAVEERRLADQKKIKDGLQGIAKLQEEGKAAEAAREASDLQQQNPKSRDAFASDRTASNLDQVETARKLLKEREKSLLAASRDIDRSATPANGDVEFPKDWKERTKGRTAGLELTAKEKAIMRALSTPISVNFRNSRLEDVIEYLKTVTGQEILLNMEALKDVEASYDTPITLTVKGVSARTIMRKVLAEIGMSYVVKDETIHVTSIERARKLMVVRRYYIGDLLGVGGALSQLNGIGGTPLANLSTTQNQTAQTVNMLIDMIKTSVDAQSWQGSGGDGTVSFHAPSMSLIVKQSAEVHAQLSSAGFGK